MPVVNYAIYGCSCWKTTTRSYHYIGPSHLYLHQNIIAVITQDRVIDGSLKRQIKNRTSYTCQLFLLNQTFQYISNWAKVFEHLPTLFLQYT